MVFTCTAQEIEIYLIKWYSYVAVGTSLLLQKGTAEAARINVFCEHGFESVTNFFLSLVSRNRRTYYWTAYRSLPS